MKGVIGSLCVVVSMLCNAVASPASDQIISKPRRESQTNAWFTHYDAASFRELPVARKTIALGSLDRDLLDAAVFHETNRRRQQHNLQALRYDAKAHAMARMQAQAMARGGFVAHENPDPKRRTMADRAKAVGARPRFLAENVASAFGRRYQSGRSFYTREENGRTIYSYEPDGPPIPMHTFVTFAEALVEGWMQSSGHRKNLLHSSPQYLGCASEPARDRSKMETFYSAQVFFTPLR